MKDLGSFRCRGVRHVIFSQSLEDIESQPPGRRGSQPKPGLLCPMGPLSAHVLKTRDIYQNSPVAMRDTLCSVVRLLEKQMPTAPAPTLLTPTRACGVLKVPPQLQCVLSSELGRTLRRRDTRRAFPGRLLRFREIFAPGPQAKARGKGKTGPRESMET